MVLEEEKNMEMFKPSEELAKLYDTAYDNQSILEKILVGAGTCLMRPHYAPFIICLAPFYLAMEVKDRCFPSKNYYQGLSKGLGVRVQGILGSTSHGCVLFGRAPMTLTENNGELSEKMKISFADMLGLKDEEPHYSNFMSQLGVELDDWIRTSDYGEKLRLYAGDNGVTYMNSERLE